ncbi:N-ethylammeline chlorohydrolase [Streptococcus pneumoniae]|nr:N-ethylammeline chlorohydrolase [Streptococcus pneumoniae]
MKIKDQTRKLATGCSKHCFEVVDSFEVVDKTDEVSNIIQQGEADVVLDIRQ